MKGSIDSLDMRDARIWSFCSAPQSCQLFGALWTAAQHLPCPSPSPRVCSNSCPLNWWCHPTISSSVEPFSSHPQSFPASGSSLCSWLFAFASAQSTRASASSSVLPTNIQGWFHLILASLISLLSKGLSRISFGITVGKHQFFSLQPSLWSNSHICTWLLEKP